MMKAELPSDELLHAVWEGRRIGADDALRLYRLPLEELGMLAHRRRQLARASAHDGRGNEIVTYIVDRNVNYTNVCNVYCKSAAFSPPEPTTASNATPTNKLTAKSGKPSPWAAPKS